MRNLFSPTTADTLDSPNQTTYDNYLNNIDGGSTAMLDSDMLDIDDDIAMSPLMPADNAPPLNPIIPLSNESLNTTPTSHLEHPAPPAAGNRL